MWSLPYNSQIRDTNRNSIPNDTDLHSDHSDVHGKHVQNPVQDGLLSLAILDTVVYNGLLNLFDKDNLYYSLHRLRNQN